MRDELDDYLVKKYSEFFKDRNASPQQSNMCFGFQCGDGWFKLLDSLCQAIQNVIVLCPFDISIRVSTVKEKFGTLRFYYWSHLIEEKDDNNPDITLEMLNPYYNQIENLVHYYEIASEHTCEECGAWGKLRGKGWIYNFCNRCWDKFRKERNIKDDNEE